MQTFFGSVTKSNASKPPSRPTPDDLTPPNGVRRSRNNQQFTQTMPACNSLATRLAFVISCDQTVEARPYMVELAIIKTSSSLSKGMIVTTGPKISSMFVLQL